MKYRESLFAKIIFLSVLVIEAGDIFIVINEGKAFHLIWLVPTVVYMIWLAPAIWNAEAVIEEDRILINFGPWHKSKIMKWEDIDYIVLDGIASIHICRLLSNKPLETRVINISWFKNMKSLIAEIVKRANKAKVDPEVMNFIRKQMSHNSLNQL